MKQSLRNLWFVAMALFALNAMAYENPEDYVSNPSNGSTVSSLSSFSVGYADGSAPTWLSMSDYTNFGVFNAAGEQVSTYDNTQAVNADPNNKGMLLIPLTKEVTEAGTYTFRVPAGYFMKGFSMKTKNIALEFTFTVEPSFVAVLDEIYLVGEPTGWTEPLGSNAEFYADWKLVESEQGSRIYHGVFDIPAGKAQFRFYDELIGWDNSKQYGYAVENKEVDQVMTKNKFTGAMVEGQGQWYFTTWFGGSMDITVDLNKMQLNIVAKRIEPVAPSLGVFEGETSKFLSKDGIDDEGYYLYYATIKVPTGEFTIGDGSAIVLGGDAAMTSGEQVELTQGGKALTYTGEGAEDVAVVLLYNLNTDRPSKLSFTDIHPVKLLSSDPADGAKLDEGITEIVLTFSEDIYTAKANTVGYDPGTEDWTPVYIANVTITDQDGNVNDPNSEAAPYILDMEVDYANLKNVKVLVGDSKGEALPDGVYTLVVNAGCIEAYNGTLNEAFTIQFTIGDPSGVEGVAVDAANAVYYTLQGLEADAENLTPGIYVKVVGKAATKVVVK